MGWSALGVSVVLLALSVWVLARLRLDTVTPNCHLHRVVGAGSCTARVCALFDTDVGRSSAYRVTAASAFDSATHRRTPHRWI